MKRQTSFHKKNPIICFNLYISFNSTGVPSLKLLWCPIPCFVHENHSVLLKWPIRANTGGRFVFFWIRHFPRGKISGGLFTQKRPCLDNFNETALLRSLFMEMSPSSNNIMGRSSVENSYRPVARGYLALGSGNLLLQVGSPGLRSKIAISQLIDVPQQPITTD